MVKGYVSQEVFGVLENQNQKNENAEETAADKAVREMSFSTGRDFYEYLQSMHLQNEEDHSDYCTAFMMA